MGNGDQASGRVDVSREADTGIIKQKVAAALSAAASQHFPSFSIAPFGSPHENWEKMAMQTQIKFEGFLFVL